MSLPTEDLFRLKPEQLRKLSVIVQDAENVASDHLEVVVVLGRAAHITQAVDSKRVCARWITVATIKLLDEDGESDPCGAYAWLNDDWKWISSYCYSDVMAR